MRFGSHRLFYKSPFFISSMKRKGGFFGTLVLLLLLVALGFSIYYLYQYWTREPVDLQIVPSQPVTVVENNVPSKQFYPRMRYQERVITYSIANSCSSDRVNSM